MKHTWNQRTALPAIEILERREAPSASPWLNENFDNLRPGSLISGWSQWSSEGVVDFAVSTNRSLSPSNGLAMTASRSTQEARCWLNGVLPADVQVKAALYLDTLIPGQVLARGHNLDTSTPSYYSLALARGLDLQLQRVVNGDVTTLATLKSAAWFSQKWVVASLDLEGNVVRVRVQRTDTGQFLNNQGQWQTQPAWALQVIDSALAGPGQVGLGRRGSYSGTVTFDDIGITVATPAEAFDHTALGTLPAGWSQWSNSGQRTFAVSNYRSLSPGNGLVMSSNLSSLETRTWLDDLLPADVQVSAGVFLDSLIPALVLARGRNLDTATPSYYSLSLARGLDLGLVRVVNGIPTPLASLRSSGWFSQRWVMATLEVQGDRLRVRVYRPDFGQFLNSQGQWQNGPVWALEITDTSLAGPGLVGLGRPASYAGMVIFDNFCVTVPPTGESFDRTSSGVLPVGWSQWSNTGAPVFSVDPTRFLSAGNGLAATTDFSRTTARAWPLMPPLTDAQAGTAVYLNSLIPAQVFARGINLLSSAPSYYAVSVARGMEIKLQRVVKGVATPLAKLSSSSWVSDLWVRVTLQVQGCNLRTQVIRLDKSQYLNDAGQWQDEPAWVLDVTDMALPEAGLAGVGRPESYTGTITFDDFAVLPATGDKIAPKTVLTTPSQGAALSGTVSVQAMATDNVGVVKVELTVDGSVRARTTSSPYSWDLDTQTLVNGEHTLGVQAFDAAGNVGRVSILVSTQNDTSLDPVNIPRHYSHIRLAELAYWGNPMGPYEEALLRQSVDLVVPDESYLEHIAEVSPQTPQLLYTNVSTLYGSLLTDWLTFADTRNFPREAAFYHVTSPTQFSGNSPSSQPVTWFWGVYHGGSSWVNFTSQARGSSSGGVAFGKEGDALVIGYPERFREINIDLVAPAGPGWTAVLEYPTQVDGAGNPTDWVTLPVSSNTTGGLKTSGQFQFDPPANWKAASVACSAPLYYVRFRTTAGGPAPIAGSLLGRDYVQARGSTGGVIPVFDSSADQNGDGYLSDTEYGRASPGKTARFFYESRAPFGEYGQMRFATNPADGAFRQWTIDYHQRFLQAQPLAAGLFVDNSLGTTPVVPGAVVEPVPSYASDYGSLLNELARAIAPRWLLANTAGGGRTSDAVIRQNTAYFEEFALRPLAQNYQQFEDLAALVAHRATLQSPAPYAIIDSLPIGGSPTDARTQLATLASYYLLADPERTFLDFYGGYEPGTTWSRHWSPAAAFDVGQPIASWSLFSSGPDPSDPALTFHVYQRRYSNALVLYKPLSQGDNRTGNLGDNTATLHPLDGTYRPLQADGTLGPSMTCLWLRNGEGAILVKG